MVRLSFMRADEADTPSTRPMTASPPLRSNNGGSRRASPPTIMTGEFPDLGQTSTSWASQSSRIPKPPPSHCISPDSPPPLSRRAFGKSPMPSKLPQDYAARDVCGPLGESIHSPSPKGFLQLDGAKEYMGGRRRYFAAQTARAHGAHLWQITVGGRLVGHRGSTRHAHHEPLLHVALQPTLAALLRDARRRL